MRVDDVDQTLAVLLETKAAPVTQERQEKMTKTRSPLNVARIIDELEVMDADFFCSQNHNVVILLRGRTKSI